MSLQQVYQFEYYYQYSSLPHYLPHFFRGIQLFHQQTVYRKSLLVQTRLIPSYLLYLSRNKNLYQSKCTNQKIICVLSHWRHKRAQGRKIDNLITHKVFKSSVPSPKMEERPKHLLPKEDYFVHRPIKMSGKIKIESDIQYPMISF